MGPLLAMSLLLSKPDPLVAGFLNVPNQDRMRMYWRVFGPAWTPSEMDYELDELKKSGAGGLVVYFMYPFALDDPKSGIKNLKFGTQEFLDSFKYASEAAKKRGLRFGLNGSTGWPFGGATVTTEDSAQRITAIPKGSLRPWGKDDRVFASTDTTNFLVGPTNMQVKRPSYGNEGLVLNHYDKDALDRYLKDFVEPMLNAADGNVKELGCDSLEVYGSNWTKDFPQEFQRRRGYDIQKALPELFDPKSEIGKGYRFDFWRTLAELTEERFTKPLGEWCGKRGIALEMEPYGTPPNPMTAARYIQTPVGEHYEWKGLSVQKYVASMAHQAGRNIISSEAWTWVGLPNRLADSLSDLKLCTDMTLLSGANDLTAVDFPYSPRSAGSPGWTPYYGPYMGPGNSQWPMFPTLVNYVNRCQWLLRQGQPVRDVAVYLPVEDSFREGPTDGMTLDFYVRDRLVSGKAPSEFGLQNGLKHQSDLVHGLIQNGFDYDGVDFWSIDRVSTVLNGTLNVGEAKYKAVVLPNLEAMDAPALRKIVEFCRSGGLVVGSRRLPDKGPGGNRQTDEVKNLVRDLFGNAPKVGEFRRFGNGSAVSVGADRDVAPTIAKLLKPTVKYSQIPPTVGFQHRRTKDRDIFFFANVGPNTEPVNVDLQTKFRNIEYWQPMTGEMWRRNAGTQQIVLAPRSSCFLIASQQSNAQNFQTQVLTEHIVNINGPWSLEFDGPDAPATIRLDELGLWTDLPKAKFFSGIGRYSSKFRINQKQNYHWRIELPQLYECASVKVNGIDCGTLISPPFTLDITKAIKNGDNTLEIAVANMPVNRFIGLPKPDLGPLRAVYGNRFQVPEEHELMKGIPAPSGLNGKVIIVGGPLKVSQN